jgi:hypothetical protein
MESVLQAVQEEQANRPVYTFPLTKRLAALDDKYIKKSFGLAKLPMREQLDALEMGKTSQGAAVFFTLVRSLVMVDGRRVDNTTAEAERIINHADPAIRDLIARMQVRISTITDAEEEEVFKGMEVRVG